MFRCLWCTLAPCPLSRLVLSASVSCAALLNLLPSTVIHFSKGDTPGGGFWIKGQHNGVFSALFLLQRLYVFRTRRRHNESAVSYILTRLLQSAPIWVFFQVCKLKWSPEMSTRQSTRKHQAIIQHVASSFSHVDELSAKSDNRFNFVISVWMSSAQVL